MAASGRKTPLWWDRDSDSTGRLLRKDVRAAANALWEQACLRVERVLGDACEAAVFMEKAVAQVSRYLDGTGSLPIGGDVSGLLMLAFSRILRRYATKLHRLELVADVPEFSMTILNDRCPNLEDCRLDAEKAARRLTPRGRTMLELRRVGFQWKEIAVVFKTTDAAIRAEFSRELKRAKVIKPGDAIGSPERPPRGAINHEDCRQPDARC